MTSPIMNALDALVKSKGGQIAEWFEAAYAQGNTPFYSSVDLRHSGHKLVPVDTNLFPAGFNNLSPSACIRAVEQIKCYIAAQSVPIKSVLILPENHTRNTGYIDNLAALYGLIEQAGLEVRIGRMDAEEDITEVQTSDERILKQYALQKDGTQVRTFDGFTPDMVLVNNDLTAGSPNILRGVTQHIMPPIGQGWYRRKKTIHFEAYDETARQFGSDFDIEPWLISSVFHKCGLINFRERKGIDCVALGVEKVIRQVKEKYTQHGIKEEPYAFVKADSGTYGMGIMIVRSGEDVVEMNKKSRNKMNAIKEGVLTTEVIIQEGIPSIDAVDGAPAEPMIYMVNGQAVGGAFRTNGEKDNVSNLNSRGMRFVGMCDEGEDGKARVTGCNFAVYGLVGRLATLAATREEYGDDYQI
ncbi:MAG: glutamate--cysteine ligase [Rickettsiales bacterium]|nr:glutamate--cysteine ligase [Rickettsiales bacterium]